MTDLTTTITTAIGHLDWCTTIPHTLDQIVGIWVEATSAEPPALPVRYGATFAEIEAAWNATRGGSTTGHADPTANALNRPTGTSTRNDADLESIDAAVMMITEAAQDIDLRTSTALDLDPWHPPATSWSRTSQLAGVVSRLHHAHAHVPAAAAIDHGIVELVRIDLAETAEWLHAKSLGIWQASRGETKTPAVQRTIAECRRCGPWRKGTIAVRNDACQQCLKFNQHHGCWPTEPIVRRWDYGQGATPGQILEARASSRRRARAS